MRISKLGLLFSLSMSALLIACDSGEIVGPVEKKLSYSMLRNDAVSLRTIVSSFESNVGEDVTFSGSTSDYSIAAVVDGKVFANNSGVTTLTISGSDNSSYTVSLNVDSYKTYDDVEFTTNGCSYGGYLVDFAVNPYAVKGTDYQINISISDQANQNFYVVSTNPEVANYVFKGETSSDDAHYISALSVGATKITIYNQENNAILCEFALNVIAGYETPNEYTYALTKADNWEGVGFFSSFYTDKTYLTFLPNGTGIFSGADNGVEFQDITFDYTFDETYIEEGRVGFDLTNVLNNGDVSFNIGYVCLFKTGNEVMLYSTSGNLMEMYWANYNS